MIAGILFTGFIALIILAVTAISNNYDRTDIVSSSFNNNFNKLLTLTDKQSYLETTRSQVTNSSGLQLLGGFDIAFNSVYTTFNLMWSVVDIFGTMGSSIISTFVFVPAVVIDTLILILLSLLTTYVIFTLMSSITRGRI